jgi:hypothetical protein
MSEQEKMDWLKAIRDEIAILKDFLDVKYATKTELVQAKENRDAFCLVREDKIDKKFMPVYGMLIFIILFLVAKYGIEFLSLLPKVG